MSSRPAGGPRFDLRRLGALVRKESVQVWRDPSAILIAFVLPIVLLFLFAYAVSLDVRAVRIGVVVESAGAAADSLAANFAATRYFEVLPARDRRQVTPMVVAGKLRGFVVIPADFDKRLAGSGTPLVQVITDGAQPNTANFVSGYADGVVTGWLAGRGAGQAGTPTRADSSGSDPMRTAPMSMAAVPLEVQPRFWFNPELESRKFLVPGAIAIVMTMIGTLLTALVVAREWERGTMEALFSTPASIPEILAGKLLPYFGLGLAATMVCALLAIHVFDVPLRGSWFALLALSCVFLVPALGQGLLISALARNQFVASQIALFAGFLPAFMLSGFLFEIDSMPAPMRALTWLVHARYFVSALQTVFLAGDIWRQFLPEMAAMLAIGAVFFAVASGRTRKSLD